MKITHISSLFPPYIGGGAERTAARLAQNLVELGNEVEIISMSPMKEESLEVENGLSIFRLPPKNIYWHLDAKENPAWKKIIFHTQDSYNFLSKVAVRERLEKTKPDVVIVHNFPGLSASIWDSCYELNIPIIQILHDYYLICPQATMCKDGNNCEKQCKKCNLFRLPHRKLSNKVTAVVGVSQFVLETHLKNGIFFKTPIKRVINNAAQISEKNRQNRENSGSINIGYIGALSKVKGVDFLCEEFLKALKKTDKQITLKIAGPGETGYVTYLKNKYKNENIEFLGLVNSSDFYETLDFSVVPSLWNDPFPGVVYEAIASGLPVIGANLGGIPEMIQPNINGLLFDPLVPDSLLNSLLKLIETDGLIEKLSSKCRESVSKFLDAENWIHQYSELLEEVVSLKKIPKI